MPFDNSEGEFKPTNDQERGFEDQESNEDFEGSAGEILSVEVQQQLSEAVAIARKPELTPEETAQVLEAIEAAGLQPGEFAAEVRRVEDGPNQMTAEQGVYESESLGGENTSESTPEVSSQVFAEAGAPSVQRPQEEPIQEDFAQPEAVGEVPFVAPSPAEQSPPVAEEAQAETSSAVVTSESESDGGPAGDTPEKPSEPTPTEEGASAPAAETPEGPQAQKERTPEEIERSRESYKGLVESAGDAEDLTDFLTQIEFASRSYLETPEGEAAFKERYGESFDQAQILEQIRTDSIVPPVPGASWAREVFDTKKHAVFEADLVRIVEREALAEAVENYARAYGSARIPLETASGGVNDTDAIALAAAIRAGEFKSSGDVALDAAYRAVVNAEQGGRDKIEEGVAGKLQHNIEARPASGSDRVSYAEALEKLHGASGVEECARVLKRHLLTGELVLVPTDQEEGKEYPSRPLGTFPDLKKELLAVDLGNPTGAHQFLTTLKRGSFDPKWGTQYVVGEKLMSALQKAETRAAESNKSKSTEATASQSEASQEQGSVSNGSETAQTGGQPEESSASPGEVATSAEAAPAVKEVSEAATRGSHEEAGETRHEISGYEKSFGGITDKVIDSHANLATSLEGVRTFQEAMNALRGHLESGGALILRDQQTGERKNIDKLPALKQELMKVSNATDPKYIRSWNKMINGTSNNFRFEDDLAAKLMPFTS